MKTWLFIGALAPVFAVPAVQAQTTALDPITVTATGQPVAQADTLAPLLMLTRDDIARTQALDLAELLRFYAGIELGRNGGTGATTSLFMRGGESNHTLVLIDGVRINPATSGGAALQNIAPDMIERIEIVKGPRAALYGSDAIAGVINVITRRNNSGSGGSAPTSAEVSVRSGSESTLDASVRGTAQLGDAGLALQVQHLRTDGIPALAGYTQNTGYDRTSINLDTHTQIGSARIGARLWDSSGETEYYGYDPLDFSRTVVAQDYRNQVLAVDAALPLGASLDAELRASRMLDEIEQQQDDDFVKTVRSGVEAGLVWRAGDAQRISGGARYVREDVTALNYGSPINDQRDILTLHAQNEISLGRHRAVIGASWSDYEGFGSRWDGTLDYGVQVLANSRIVASVGTGFRAPDAHDRFGFGGTPDLQPERARTYELGWQQQISASQRADLRVFRNDVDDLINLTCDANFICTAINVDEYRNDGVELSYHLNLADWSATLTGLVQDPQDRNTGAQLLRRAKRSAALRVNRSFARWDAGFDLLANGDRPDIDALGNVFRAGGYALLNLHAGARITPRTELRLRVENVLDTDYQTAAGYNQPGASVFVGLRHSL